MNPSYLTSKAKVSVGLIRVSRAVWVPLDGHRLSRLTQFLKGYHFVIVKAAHVL